jgi:hypothetical protein
LITALQNGVRRSARSRSRCEPGPVSARAGGADVEGLTPLLESPENPEADGAVSAAHTTRALDDLLDTGQQLKRSPLGVGNNPEELPGRRRPWLYPRT